MCCFIASLSSCSCFTPRAAQPKIGLCPFPACRDPRLGTLKLLHIRPSLGLVFSLSPFSSQQQQQLFFRSGNILLLFIFFFFFPIPVTLWIFHLGAFLTYWALSPLTQSLSSHLSNPFATTTTLIRLKKDFSLGRVSISFWAASFKTEPRPDQDQTRTVDPDSFGLALFYA